MSALVDALTAHRACHGAEHDPQNGRIHGYCIPCGVPWPCEIAQVGFDAAKEARAATGLAAALAKAVAAQHHDFPADEDTMAPAQTVCGACGGTSPCSDSKCWVPEAAVALRAAGRLQ